MDEENKDEKETEENNYMQIVEKKESDLTLNLALKCDELNKEIKKDNDINKNKKENFLSFQENNINKTILNINTNEEEQKKNKQINSQTNILKIYKYRINNNKFNVRQKSDKEIIKTKKVRDIYSLGFKKEKSREKKIIYRAGVNNTEFHDYTQKNIKRIKKLKKYHDSDSKKPKLSIIRQRSFIPTESIKKVKIIIKDKDNEIKKKTRHSLIYKHKENKSKNIFINILNNNIKNNLKKNKSKHIKMKSLEEKNNQIFKFVRTCNKKPDNGNGSPKRKINFCYKLKIDDSFKESENSKNQDMPKSSKTKKRVSIFVNNIDNKKRKSFFNGEDKSYYHKKKKSIFYKEKDQINCFKEKDKKSSSKKTIRIKQKDKEQKIKKYISNASQLSKKIIRKEKSYTKIQTNKRLISEEDNNENILISSNKNNRIGTKNYSTKPSPQLNDIDSNNNVNRSDIRRNSTDNIRREKNHKEKITALTNKQTIKNLNEYIRQCLEIIPDLYELKEKMPRCKTKINPNFSKDKKIALFDLDETIVHCNGEINMNNIDSLSMQSDARIKVHLPGGKREATIGINIRPHWEEALSKIKDKYHIVAFTASHESYADSVLNCLDPNHKYFEYRLYRAHCVLCIMDEMKFYVKDLKILEDNYDLKDIVIIDNSVLSFAYHLDNGIPISPFYDSKVDTELLDIADFLVKYADENDIRDKLKEVYKLNEYLEILKNYVSEGNEDNEDSSYISCIEEENKTLTAKNIKLSKNKTAVDLNQPLVVNNINIDNSNDNNENTIKNNNKLSSQINLKLKIINDMFNDDNKDEHNGNHYIPKSNDLKIRRYLTKNFEDKQHHRNKKREKEKTLRFDINFKKEWDEKKKELNNQK